MDIRWARGFGLWDCGWRCQGVLLGEQARESLGAECSEQSRLTARAKRSRVPGWLGPGAAGVTSGKRALGHEDRQSVQEARGGSCGQGRPERCG